MSNYNDYFDDKDISKNTKREVKRKRNQKYQRHLKYLYEELYDHSWLPPVIYVRQKWIRDKNNNYVLIDIPKPYYKRIYRSNSHRGVSNSKYYKKQANRKVRRYKGELPNGGYYKKIAEYWWNIC